MTVVEEKPVSPTPTPDNESWGHAAQPPAAVIEFLPDARALEERPMPRAARATLYVIAGLLGAAVLWAAIARVDRIVVAPGRLALDIPKLVVQPLETSIIRSLDASLRSGEPLAGGEGISSCASCTATRTSRAIAARPSSTTVGRANSEPSDIGSTLNQHVIF